MNRARRPPLALATSTLRVGSLVFDNDFRHRALLAKEAATIDVLTGGRFKFGIRAGRHKHEYDQVGIPFESPLVRVRRVQEARQFVARWRADDVVRCYTAGRLSMELTESPTSRASASTHDYFRTSSARSAPSVDEFDRQSFVSRGACLLVVRGPEFQSNLREGSGDNKRAANV